MVSRLAFSKSSEELLSGIEVIEHLKVLLVFGIVGGLFSLDDIIEFFSSSSLGWEHSSRMGIGGVLVSSHGTTADVGGHF